MVIIGKKYNGNPLEIMEIYGKKCYTAVLEYMYSYAF